MNCSQPQAVLALLALQLKCYLYWLAAGMRLLQQKEGVMPNILNEMPQGFSLAVVMLPQLIIFMIVGYRNIHEMYNFFDDSNLRKLNK